MLHVRLQRNRRKQGEVTVNASTAQNTRDPILEVHNLKKYFPTKHGILHAVDDVSFTLERGKTLGIVGESGCGKSTIGRTILRLLEPTAGKVYFEGKDIYSLSKREMPILRKNMQMIFQDPFSSLDPRMSVSDAIGEALQIQFGISRAERQKQVRKVMDTVGLASRLADTYPHELDGGRRQRVGIGRALALNPKFLICDEPVSALDVSIQAQILNLLLDLQEALHLTYIFITHDLSVVRYFSDEIAVMYMGRLVEMAPTDVLFENPLHPYTQALLSAIPKTDIHNRRERIFLPGEVSSPINPPAECRFAPRCRFACDRCRRGEPAPISVSDKHRIACVLHDQAQSTGIG